MPILKPSDAFWDFPAAEIAAKSAISRSNCGNITVRIELTLSLRKDDEETLFKTYVKILKALGSMHRMTDHIGYFERGSNGHLHIHALLTFELSPLGSLAGLIEEQSKMICLIIRRKWSKSNFFPMGINYTCVPFKIQVNTREGWDKYISKDGDKIDIYDMCKKYKLFLKL